jgi:thymidylate kinase
MSARGCIFVLEGLDRAGKTTQATMLAQHLRSSFKVRSTARWTPGCKRSQYKRELDVPIPSHCSSTWVCRLGLQYSRFASLQAKVKEIKFPDRTTQMGQIINKYLVDEIDMEDHAIHLLFSANRWECKCASMTLTVLQPSLDHSGLRVRRICCCTRACQ